MKVGKSLVELATEIEARKAQKVDFITPTSQIELGVETRGANGRQEIVLHVPTPAANMQGTYDVRPIAHDQIGAFTEIPSRYYDRMLRDQPELLAQNVNTWLHRDQRSKRMVRTIGGSARAFLSNRYQRIENEEIAAVALPILLGDKNLQVVSAEVTERKLFIQATTSRVVGDVKKGDAVQAGVIISNSEVGQGSVSVQRMVYRLVCLNGMVLPDGKYRANHTGARLDDNEALWKDDTRQAEDKSILLKVRDLVSAAMSEGPFNASLEKVRESTQQRITGNPAKAIEVLSAKLGVTETEQGGILRALIEGADLSRWGVINAVTAQAHVANDYDRSVEFEAMGARVLDLTPADWSVVAEAA